MSGAEEPRAAVTVLAPVDGTVVAMAGVPDPVFADEVVGPGTALDPDLEPGVVAVVAPVDGTVVKLHPHAFVVAVDGPGGRGVLVHLGLDTVQLGGAGFELRVAEGDRVTSGTTVLRWHPADVVAGGRSAVSPVVALQADASSIHHRTRPGDRVRAGEPLFEWR